MGQYMIVGNGLQVKMVESILMKNVLKSMAYKYLKKCPVLYYVLKVWMISCFAMALKLSKKNLTFNFFCF
jgi:hypothetical protein